MKQLTIHIEDEWWDHLVSKVCNQVSFEARNKVLCRVNDLVFGTVMVLIAEHLTEEVIVRQTETE